jgi:hypothetical protein
LNIGGQNIIWDQQTGKFIQAKPTVDTSKAPTIFDVGGGESGYYGAGGAFKTFKAPAVKTAPAADGPQMSKDGKFYLDTASNSWKPYHDPDDFETMLQNAMGVPSGGAPGGKTAKTAAKPLPDTQDELEEGEIYQTSRGPAKWDGSQFIPQSQ